ncbi:4-amino-4-deoxychorismate lyase protein [Dioscorea alata]|uniref:4-amino-4-deoxychorismate lyase protein n=1 Tax=Dioscorea alata TaxID=55571 RepID=A0ACB7W4T4_DIOAL|nr:4-amino-4-deoxychorismate lyase protein [Dioscorea alata]
MASSLTFLCETTLKNAFPSRSFAFPSGSHEAQRLSFGFHGVALRRAKAEVKWRSSREVRAVENSSWAGSADTDINNLFDAPVLSNTEVAERLRTYQEQNQSNQHYMAMFSSIFGGITTDPAAMVIPMDDHMVHRGHGVFDTAAIMDGHLYELDQHLDRLLRSASMAKIGLPFDRSTIRNILINTVSASKCTRGSLRYWLSVGPGDFQLSSSGCAKPALYAIVIEGRSLPDQKGVRVITSSIPMKSPEFAIMKNVNYLPNALSKMEAEENGAFAGIWLDNEGYVAEGPNMNVAFVTADKELMMPHFDKILSGCTAKRVLVLAEKLISEGMIDGIRLGNVSVEQGKMADEMMLIGSGIIVKPVLQWDKHIIGDGKEGPVAKALFDLIVEDMQSGPASVRVPVPY